MVTSLRGHWPAFRFQAQAVVKALLPAVDLGYSAILISDRALLALFSSGGDCSMEGLSYTTRSLQQKLCLGHLSPPADSMQKFMHQCRGWLGVSRNRRHSQLLVVSPSLLPDVTVTHVISLPSPAQLSPLISILHT